jgi:DNA-binding PadR family transcriptional regulator
MQCEEVREKIAEYVKGELQEPARSQFEQHLRVCDACRAEAADLKMLWTDLGSIPATEPGPESRARFDMMLEAYKQGVEQARSERAMPETETLGPFEQKVLTAMLTLEPETDSVAIHDKLCGMTGKRVNLDTLYTALDRLEEKGLLAARQSDAENSLRGRPKRLYRIEAAGLRALEESLESAKRLSKIFEENSGSVRRWITNFAKKGLHGS